MSSSHEPSNSQTQAERVEAVQKIEYNGEESGFHEGRRFVGISEPEADNTVHTGLLTKNIGDDEWVETKTLQINDEAWRPKEGNTVFVQVAYGEFNKYIVENGELVLIEKDV